MDCKRTFIQVCQFLLIINFSVSLIIGIFTFDSLILGRPRPKIYGYCRIGYISQKFGESAPDLDFAYTRGDISQKIGESAPDLDFTNFREPS